MILFYDTETSGLVNQAAPPDHPSQPHLVQLGALLIDESGAEWATVEVIVKPDGYVIPDGAAKVHGITTEVAKRAGVPLALAVATFVHLRAAASAVVAYNLRFDDLVMRASVCRTGRVPSHPGPERQVCAMELATPVVGLPPSDRMKEYGFAAKCKPPKLIEAYRFFFGEDFEGAHGALADARACARVFFELKRRAEAEEALRRTPLEGDKYGAGE